ncbi:MAG: 16S rRNA (cytosine(1402)-N(4))-methyltransferase [Acidobacteria bacterium]|nr:16S rRNA (cytosine(1402)-N(4))-methyltransferase [Acidobacteriota bacterium]
MDRHRPVMPEEVIEMLASLRGGVIVDGTLGMGGHTELILSRAPHLKVLGLDRDAESLELARDRLRPFGERFEGVHADYRDISRVCTELIPPNADSASGAMGSRALPITGSKVAGVPRVTSRRRA